MTKMAVFASGHGSNLKALIDAMKRKELSATIELVVSDRSDCYALVRARQERIPNFAFHPREYENRSHYEKLIVAELEKRGVEYLVLVVYASRGPRLERYPGESHIHPSLCHCFQVRMPSGTWPAQQKLGDHLLRLMRVWIQVPLLLRNALL